MESKTGKEVLAGAAFFLIFALLLSALTLIYYPKWDPSTPHGQMAGF